MAAGVWDGADRPAGLEERLGSPLLRLLLAGSKVVFVVCRSHEDVEDVGSRSGGAEYASGVCR